jgi:hypothetical protein
MPFTCIKQSIPRMSFHEEIYKVAFINEMIVLLFSTSGLSTLYTS